MRIRGSECAADRLEAIEEFVAEHDPLAAERLVVRVIDRVEPLAERSLLGRVLPAYPGGKLRELVVSNYRVAYRVSDAAVEVLTVFEGHRLLRADEFGEEPDA